MKAASAKPESSPSTWQIWVAAAGLWLLTSLILVCVSVGLVVSFVTWFVCTPILVAIKLVGRAK